MSNPTIKDMVVMQKLVEGYTNTPLPYPRRLMLLKLLTLSESDCQQVADFIEGLER